MYLNANLVCIVKQDICLETSLNLFLPLVIIKLAVFKSCLSLIM